jgi:hypothetical protein
MILSFEIQSAIDEMAEALDDFEARLPESEQSHIRKLRALAAQFRSGLCDIENEFEEAADCALNLDPAEQPLSVRESLRHLAEMRDFDPRIDPDCPEFFRR